MERPSTEPIPAEDKENSIESPRTRDGAISALVETGRAVSEKLSSWYVNRQIRKAEKGVTNAEAWVKGTKGKAPFAPTFKNLQWYTGEMLIQELKKELV